MMFSGHSVRSETMVQRTRFNPAVSVEKGYIHDEEPGINRSDV